MIYRKEKLETRSKTRAQPCPEHQDANAVWTDASNVQYAVINYSKFNPAPYVVQYRCAEPDCNQNLGWEFHNPRARIFQHGPGGLRDQAVPHQAVQHAMAAEQHGENVKDWTSGAICLTLAASAAAFIWSIDRSGGWNTATTYIAAAAIPFCASAAYAVYQLGRKTAPRPENQAAESQPG